MSEKTTYIYKIEMGHYPNVEEIMFCYARNQNYVLSHFKKAYKDKHYNLFKTYKVGIADSLRHPGPFELLPKDEEEYIRKIRSTVGERYAERRRKISRIFEDTILEQGSWDPVSESQGEPIQSDRESISDSDE